MFGKGPYWPLSTAVDLLLFYSVEYQIILLVEGTACAITALTIPNLIFVILSQLQSIYLAVTILIVLAKEEALLEMKAVKIVTLKSTSWLLSSSLTNCHSLISQYLNLTLSSSNKG